MTFDVKTLGAINLAFQVLLMILVFVASYLAKKKNFSKHCTIMRAAVALQIIAILAIMLPSMIGYITHEQKGIFFNIPMLVHHTMGLAVVALWVYINLAVAGRLKLPGRLAIWMRLAMSLWVLTFLLGLYMYVQILNEPVI